MLSFFYHVPILFKSYNNPEYLTPVLKSKSISLISAALTFGWIQNWVVVSILVHSGAVTSPKYYAM